VPKDHLGSASVVTDASGAVVGEDRFYFFEGARFTTETCTMRILMAEIVARRY